MDTLTKSCLLQVIGDSEDAKQIMLEMEAFMEDSCHPKQLLNRKRILWLHGKRICGQELVNQYQMHGRDIGRLCASIDKKRRRAESKNWLKAVHRLASDLSNDETPIKQRLLDLACCFESVKDLFQFLQLFKKLGFRIPFRESLQTCSPQEFVALVQSAYRQYSIREQSYQNAKLCADSIVSVRLVKPSTLAKIKTVVEEKLEVEGLHERSVLIFNLVQCGWQGPLHQQVEALYKADKSLSEFLPQPPTTSLLCCYLLLCPLLRIRTLKAFLIALNQQSM